ncbi:MAG: recombination protein RecR [Lentisphaerae bacterium]|nr:recombination protein RecR [Lentisphaerota bacterium]
MSNISSLPKALQSLVEQLSRLPGVGKRSAERLALALLQWPDEHLGRLAEDLRLLHERIKSCRCCGNYSEQELCPLCSSSSRRRELLCVVESAVQISVIERSQAFQGLYHVLGGKLSPLNGKGPQDLRIKELAERLDQGGIAELIIATSPDMEGEATAHYLAEEFAHLPITISRIASGIPAGADLSHADAATLGLAMHGRRNMKHGEAQSGEEQLGYVR